MANLSRRDLAQILQLVLDEANQALRVEGNITTSNPSVGTNGATAPTSSSQVAGQNPSGNLEPVQTDASGNLKVNVVAGTISAENPSVSNTGSAVPTYATYLAANEGGNLTGLTSTINGLQVDGSAVTQPISAASLPLPTGAATSANQTTANSSLSSIVSYQSTSVNYLSSISAGQAGAATAANQVTGNSSLSTIATNTTGVATAANQTTANSSLSTIATNTANISNASKGRSTSNPPVYNSYTSTNVTTSSYVQMVASTNATTNMIEIFDSSGQSLILGVGAMGSEVIQLYTLPGGNGQVPLAIPAGSRVSVKALTGNATSGYLVINFYS